jgi:hypothetical protein
LNFREAFFIDPSQVVLADVSARPVHDLVKIIEAEYPDLQDSREWIPVFGFTRDIFYVRRNLTKNHVEQIKNDVYNLESSYQRMNANQIKSSNVLPRLINKYLWLLDYYEFQHYDLETLQQIRTRLIELDEGIFKPYFQKGTH